MFTKWQIYPAELKEDTVANCPFRSYPKKKKSQYPKPAEVLQVLHELYVKDGSEWSLSHEFQQGEEEFWVSKTYIETLFAWANRTPLDVDLSIDNSTLCRRMDEVSARLSRRMWKILIGWFGGGPELKTRYVPKDKSFIVPKDKNFIVLRVCTTSDLHTFRRFLFRSGRTVEEAKNEICENFGLIPSNCKLHDYYKGKLFQRLDREGWLTRGLGRCHLTTNNIVVLEERSATGFEICEKVRYAVDTSWENAFTSSDIGRLLVILKPLRVIYIGHKSPVNKIKRFLINERISENLEILRLVLDNKDGSGKVCKILKSVSVRSVPELSFYDVNEATLMPISLFLGGMVRPGIGNRPLCFNISGNINLGKRNGDVYMKVDKASVERNLGSNLALNDKHSFYCRINFKASTNSRDYSFWDKHTSATFSANRD